jgi:hypothetical protein
MAHFFQAFIEGAEASKKTAFHFVDVVCHGLPTEQESRVGRVDAGEAAWTVAGVVESLAGPAQNFAAAVASDWVAVGVGHGGSDDAVLSVM